MTHGEGPGVTGPGQRVRSHERQVDLLWLLGVLALLSVLGCCIRNIEEESEQQQGRGDAGCGHTVSSETTWGLAHPNWSVPRPCLARESSAVVPGKSTRTETSRLKPGTCQSSIHPPGEHTPLPTARDQLTVPENKMEKKGDVARSMRKQAKIRMPRQRKQKQWTRQEDDLKLMDGLREMNEDMGNEQMGVNKKLLDFLCRQDGVSRGELQQPT